MFCRKLRKEIYMKEDLSKIYSSTTIKGLEKYKVPEEVIERRIKSDLANGLAHFIVDNMEKIPSETRRSYNHKNDEEEIIMEINIISDEELRRLRQIEIDYNQLRFGR
jgi:F0F1-type ATP synthase delta subunit